MLQCSVLVLKKLCSLLLKGYTWPEDLDPRDEQLQSIKAVYNGLNVFVCLYQQDLEKVFVTRSFLVYLMVDQVEDLRRRKVETSFITSGSDLTKPFLAGETSLCTDSLLFCAP